MPDSNGFPEAGDKMRYREDAHTDQVRWGSNDDPRGVLIVGQVYTVVRREVHSWHTKVWLREFPDLKFNAIHFSAEEGTGDEAVDG